MSASGWQQLQFETNDGHVEALEDWLFEHGAVAVTLEDNADEPLLEPGPGETPMWQKVRLSALFYEGVDLMPMLAAVPSDWGAAMTDTPIHVPDQDWERAWMDNFHPMQMGSRLWICPSWIAPPEPDAVNVLLDPGLAFGTGTHPTTAMCLTALDRLVTPGMTVVDYGCGTGILAIAALKLGASQALGVDNDPQALTASHQNAERNGISPSCFTVVAPDSEDISGWQGSADCVVANILAGPLSDLAPRLLALLKPGGYLLLAGLLADQADGLIERYRPHIDLSVVNRVEEWALLEGRAANEHSG